jgi:hypothetical protein
LYLFRFYNQINFFFSLMGAILIRVGAILLNVGRFDLKLNLNTLMLLK